MDVFPYLVKGIIGGWCINVQLEAEPIRPWADWKLGASLNPPDRPSRVNAGYAYELVPVGPSCFRRSRLSPATLAS
jgi:hypothetical protein